MASLRAAGTASRAFVGTIGTRRAAVGTASSQNTFSSPKIIVDAINRSIEVGSEPGTTSATRERKCDVALAVGFVAGHDVDKIRLFISA